MNNVKTEDAQLRAERIFFYSIERVRDPAGTYEIYLMKNLAGFDTRTWRTNFTNYRFAIPDFAGGRGRAIYNDVDEIYLADPAPLFDLPMVEAGYLAITPADTAVMLIDCARMAEIWTLERAQRLGKKTLLELAGQKPGLWAPLPAQWHARDTEYRAGFTACLHYTALNQQPWQPAPDQYSYHPHPLGELWLDLERDADAAGYEIFSTAAPSPAFADANRRLSTAPRLAAPADLAQFARGCASMATLGPLAAAAQAGLPGQPLQPDALQTAGNALFMDDANVPSLLSLPYLGCGTAEDPVYVRTRRLVLSDDNQYFFRGRAAEGIGGPHVGLRMVWPLGITMRALTSGRDPEVLSCLRALAATHAGTGFMHEAFHKDDPKKFTRSWFAWANTIFGELVLKTFNRPHLLDGSQSRKCNSPAQNHPV